MQDLSDVPDTLPEFLHAFFWDTNPKRVSPRRHMNAVCLRLMERGDESAIRWLLQTYRRERLRAWIMAQEGRGLTPRALRFWEVLLDLPHPQTSDLERARRFYVRARQARTGLAQTATPGRWAYCVLTSRAGMSGAISRWFGGIKDLFYIADRLLRVQDESTQNKESCTTH